MRLKRRPALRISDENGTCSTPDDDRDRDRSRKGAKQGDKERRLGTENEELNPSAAERHADEWTEEGEGQTSYSYDHEHDALSDAHTGSEPSASGRDSVSSSCEVMSGQSAECILPAGGAKQVRKLKRFLNSLQHFANDVSLQVAARINEYIIQLLSGRVSVERFQELLLQEPTTFPLKPFVIPFLKANIPLLQRELIQLSELLHLSPDQFIIRNPAWLSTTESADSSSDRINSNDNTSRSGKAKEAVDDTKPLACDATATQPSILNPPQPVSVPHPLSRKRSHSRNSQKSVGVASHSPPEGTSDTSSSQRNTRRPLSAGANLSHSEESSKRMHPTLLPRGHPGHPHPHLFSEMPLIPLHKHYPLMLEQRRRGGVNPGAGPPNVVASPIALSLPIPVLRPLRSVVDGEVIPPALMVPHQSSSLTNGVLSSQEQCAPKRPRLLTTPGSPHSPVDLSSHRPSVSSSHLNGSPPQFNTSRHSSGQPTAEALATCADSFQKDLKSCEMSVSFILSLGEKLKSELTSIRGEYTNIHDIARKLHDDTNSGPGGSCNKCGSTADGALQKLLHPDERLEIELRCEQRIAAVTRNAEELVSDVKRQAVREINKSMDNTQNCDARLHHTRTENETLRTKLLEMKRCSIQVASKENCWNCGRSAADTCSGCNRARYCGAFCQHKDWPIHAFSCKSQSHAKPAAEAEDETFPTGTLAHNSATDGTASGSEDSATRSTTGVAQEEGTVEEANTEEHQIAQAALENDTLAAEHPVQLVIKQENIDTSDEECDVEQHSETNTG